MEANVRRLVKATRKSQLLDEAIETAHANEGHGFGRPRTILNIRTRRSHNDGNRFTFFRSSKPTR